VQSTIVETFDNGAHWASLGGPLPSDLLVQTLDIAASDGDRLYVSGAVVQDGSLVGVVEASRDHGKTWSRTLVDMAGAFVFIGAVDPTNPDRLYLRTQTDAADALLVSSDGAATFQGVTTVQGPMLGLAVSPDGRRVAIGGPNGVLVADRDTLAFEQRASTAINCLAWSVDGLFACGQTGGADFVVGLSADDGATFVPRLARLGDIDGLLATCPNTEPIVQACAAGWEALATVIGVDAGGVPAVDAGPVRPAYADRSVSAGCATQPSKSPRGAAAFFGLLAWAAYHRIRRRSRGYSSPVTKDVTTPLERSTCRTSSSKTPRAPDGR
jgi:hypothetical protein